LYYINIRSIKKTIIIIQFELTDVLFYWIEILTYWWK